MFLYITWYFLFNKNKIDKIQFAALLVANLNIYMHLNIFVATWINISKIYLMEIYCKNIIVIQIFKVFPIEQKRIAQLLYCILVIAVIYLTNTAKKILKYAFKEIRT